MRFQFWSMSGDSRVEILLRSSSVQVCLIVLNQGCYGFGQYNLPDGMLRLDDNTTLNKSYVLFIALVNITYQSGDQYLPSIHSWDSSPCRCYISHCFFLCVFFNCLLCSACILQMHNKPVQFLIQIKVYFLMIIIYSFIFYFFFLLIKRLFSHETGNVSRLFCLLVLFLALKL